MYPQVSTNPARTQATERVRPFLKWAGGKRWFATHHRGFFPLSFGRYYEPFVGSGAIFFSLAPKIAFLSDANHELIQTYQAVRQCPDEIYEELARHQALHSKEHFYEVRASVPDSAVKAAARMIYLNRTCWNGLYRVNRSGTFNVPIGTKSAVLLPFDDFQGVALALSNTDIQTLDFAVALERAKSDDLAFIDPPYTVKHNNNGFLKYNQHIFSWDDQIRLRNIIKKAADRGVKIVLTNADHSSVRDIYRGIGLHFRANRQSILASNSLQRTPTTEFIVAINFEPFDFTGMEQIGGQ